jgi:peptidoglycan/xylan/chitin deacetylase (PgdA/CDA1 family)
MRVVSGCDSGWTQLDATVSHDSTTLDTGSGSLKLIAPASNKAQAQLTFSAQDWSQSAFGIRMRFDDYSKVNDGYIILSTSGTFTQFFRAQFTPKLSTVINNEWIEFTLTREDFDFNSGTASWSTVNGMRIQVYGKATAPVTMWVDQVVRYPTPARPTISVAFDDGFATTASLAKPKMDQYGFRGSAFVIAQRIGTNGYLSQAQVDTLAQAGWDISGHGDINLTTLSPAAAEADVLLNKQYLVERGYKGGDVYAYPNDGQSFAIRTMVAKYFSAARGLSTFGQTRAYVPRRRFQGYQAGTALSVATIQAWLGAGIANNSWMVLTFHNLPNSTSLPEDYLPADFNTLIDYIATSGVQVLPISEALAASDAPPILRAANGNQYRLNVDNSGVLSTTLI